MRIDEQEKEQPDMPEMYRNPQGEGILYNSWWGRMCGWWGLALFAFPLHQTERCSMSIRYGWEESAQMCREVANYSQITPAVRHKISFREKVGVLQSDVCDISGRIWENSICKWQNCEQQSRFCCHWKLEQLSEPWRSWLDLEHACSICAEVFQLMASSSAHVH